MNIFINQNSHLNPFKLLQNINFSPKFTSYLNSLFGKKKIATEKCRNRKTIINNTKFPAKTRKKIQLFLLFFSLIFNLSSLLGIIYINKVCTSAHTLNKIVQYTRECPRLCTFCFYFFCFPTAYSNPWKRFPM